MLRYQYEHWGEKLQANSPPNGRSWTDHDPHVVVKTIATFNTNKHVPALKPIYSDTTQLNSSLKVRRRNSTELNSTSSWVVLCRYKHPFRLSRRQILLCLRQWQADALCCQPARPSVCPSVLLFVCYQLVNTIFWKRVNRFWCQLAQVRLCLWTLEKRRNRCDLIEVFKMFYGYREIDIRVLFTLDGNDKGLRGHRKKIVNQVFTRILLGYFFSNWVFDRRDSLDQDTVDAPSLNCFKNRLNKIRCTSLGFFMD